MEYFEELLNCCGYAIVILAITFGVSTCCKTVGQNTTDNKLNYRIEQLEAKERAK